MTARYQILHNVDGFPMSGWSPGQTLADGYEGKIPESLRGAGMETILDWVWTRHNGDNRPDGQTAPSLSCGDVVVISFSPDWPLWYTVVDLGWEVVSPSGADRSGLPWRETYEQHRKVGR